MTDDVISPSGIVGVVLRMRYSVPESHTAFECIANVLRNRVMDLERELQKYKAAVEVLDKCKLALYDAAQQQWEVSDGGHN